MDDMQVGCRTIGRAGKRSDTVLQRRERLRELIDAISMQSYGARIVVIEGPSYASVGGSTHDRSGAWWLLVDALLETGTPVAVCPPATRAKWATGSGRADKEKVIASMRARFPRVDIANDNEADALALATMGMAHLGLLEAPAGLAATLDAVAWPD